MNPDKPFAAEGYALMGAAFEVHKVLGGGLSEPIYQESMEFELIDRKIPFQPKTELKVFYKHRQLKTRYIPDLVTHDMIVVELKALAALTSEHEGQLLNYMRISQRPVGYLINFGPVDNVEWKRFVLSQFLK